MGKAPNLDDYNEVPERIKDFRQAFPQGTLQAECQFSEVDGRWWVVVKAYAFREPNDPRPGTGLAWEVVPGKTPYTRDSELQNAETSAWGRAIIAVGASDAKKIASREEVRNRTAEELPPPPPLDNELGRAAMRKLCEEKKWPAEGVATVFRQRFGKSPRVAPNDELMSFVNLIKEGAITITVDANA